MKNSRDIATHDANLEFQNMHSPQIKGRLPSIKDKNDRQMIQSQTVNGAKRITMPIEDSKFPVLRTSQVENPNTQSFSD